MPGPKGYQATNVTGPGGQPVAGDPKARLPKTPGFGVQIGQMPMGALAVPALIADSPAYGGFADPYMHYNAAMFGAPGFNPYAFPPTAYMHPQQLQAHAAALAAAAAAAAAAAGAAQSPQTGVSPSALTSPNQPSYGSPAISLPSGSAAYGQGAVGPGTSPQHVFTPFGAAAGPYPWGTPGAEQAASFAPFLGDRAPGSSPALAPSQVRDSHASATTSPFGSRSSPNTALGGQRYVSGGEQGQRWPSGTFSPAVGSVGTPPAVSGNDGLLYSTAAGQSYPH